MFPKSPLLSVDAHGPALGPSGKPEPRLTSHLAEAMPEGASPSPAGNGERAQAEPGPGYEGDTGFSVCCLGCESQHHLFLSV